MRVMLLVPIGIMCHARLLLLFEPLLFLSAWVSIEVYCLRVYVLLKDSILVYVTARALILTHYYFLDFDPRLFFGGDLDHYFLFIHVFLGLQSKIILF